MKLDDIKGHDDVPREWIQAAHAELRSALRGRDVAVPKFWIAAIIYALVPLIREQITREAEPEPEICGHATGDYYYNFTCELLLGHDDLHEYRYHWSGE